jgi:hypothetical protein
MAGIIDALLASDETSVRWKVRTQVLGEPAGSPRLRRLREEIRRSPRVNRLLSALGEDGRLSRQAVYAKWQGAHWVLAALADLGYPPGDAALVPMREQILDTWLAPQYLHEFEAASAAAAYRGRGVPLMRGRYRRCASQQGNALRSLTLLGLADERVGRLAERLLHWQWPDGGWNCDVDPAASMSSFFETLLPMRGLAAYRRATGDETAGRAATSAAEVFLSRRLLFRRSTGELIRPDFAVLHYPLYWHYDLLGGLVGMVEVGTIADPRCAEALDLLESMRLPDGGWPVRKRYYRASSQPASGNDFVDWGGTSARRMNEWATADALAVLRAAGRW